MFIEKESLLCATPAGVECLSLIDPATNIGYLRHPVILTTCPNRLSTGYLIMCKSFDRINKIYRIKNADKSGLVK
ncbi:hypothetical protein DMA11_25065 [Marinilabiliaceae bacterium JC017]|nr:hypothetical protein DMA11_25065 [Marinilabiliaceae bacterium JC017]